MRKYMKNGVLTVFLLLILSGCSYQKTVSSVDKAEEMTEEQPGQVVTDFDQEEINASLEEETSEEINTSESFSDHSGGESDINNFPGVAMTLLAASNTDIRVGLLNTTDVEVSFGEDYDLQELVDGEWVSMPYLIDNWAIWAIEYVIPEHEMAEWETNWEIFHGALAPGRYRLVKSVTNSSASGDDTKYKLGVEFEIEEENHKDLQIMTEPPVLHMQDVLSSTYETFEVRSGNYTWYCKAGSNGEMRGGIACGSGPLDEAKEKERLKLPRYNRLDCVYYMVSWEEMPDSMTVKEYDIADLGNTDAEPLSAVNYDELFSIDLKPDRVYEISAAWEEEKMDENGFYGSASYIIATE